MKRVKRIALLITAAVTMATAVPISGLAEEEVGNAARYDSSYDGGGWERIFRLQRSWGNGIEGALLDPQGFYCVKPGYEVGQRLRLTGSNGVTLTCTIGDYVQQAHQTQWVSRWVVEVSHNLFFALGLHNRNQVTVEGLASGGNQAAPDPCRHFEVTDQYVCHTFLAFWEEHGGLEIFGYPLTGEMDEDGRTVQYFERAVFEEEDGAVLLRRVGAEALSKQ